MKNNLNFDFKKDKNPFHVFSSNAEEDLQELKILILNEQNASFLIPIFLELIQNFKGTLGSIKSLTSISRGKFSDKEFGDYFNRSIIGDIEKIDLMLNSVLNYLKVNAAVKKTNTIHTLIEEVLGKNQVRVENKKIRVFKKLEKDLPETIVPDEHLRYIFNSCLQYALASIPVHGNLGFLTKSLVTQKEVTPNYPVSKGGGKYIDISFIFTGYKKSVEKVDQFDTLFRTSDPKKEEVRDLELRLIDEIVKKNRGEMKFEVDEIKAKTLISLIFPVERRKVVCIKPLN